MNMQANTAMIAEAFDDSVAVAQRRIAAVHAVETRAKTANAAFYQELELRYGGAFAQWLVDRM